MGSEAWAGKKERMACACNLGDRHLLVKTKPSGDWLDILCRAVVFIIIEDFCPLGVV